MPRRTTTLAAKLTHPLGLLVCERSSYPRAAIVKKFGGLPLFVPPTTPLRGLFGFVRVCGYGSMLLPPITLTRDAAWPWPRAKRVGHGGGPTSPSREALLGGLCASDQVRANAFSPCLGQLHPCLADDKPFPCPACCPDFAFDAAGGLSCRCFRRRS